MEMNCKINTTAFNPETKMIKLSGANNSWPFHPQDLSTPKLYMQMIDVLFEVERDTDPGVDVDSYMVVYKDKHDMWKEWLKYDKQPIKRGTFHVIIEERNGGNYQMFNTAYQMLKDRYDWFIFTCDDIMVFGDQYYKKILDRWEGGCGYVGLQGIGDYHVQGSIGLTNKEVLEKVCKFNNGELPHNKEDWTQEKNIFGGELPFTHSIIDLGYHFVAYNDSQTWNKENLCYPYYLYVNNK